MYESPNQRAALDRFRSVDALADRIFERIPELGDNASEPDAILSKPDPAEPGRDSNVVPLFASETSDAGSILAKTEKLLGGLIQALEGWEDSGRAAQQETHGKKPNFATAPDISYRAAQRQQQLPEGVEILTSAPSATSDETIMKSIRSLIDAQEVEFEELRVAEKRKKAKEILAPLEPQDNLEVPQPELPVQQKSRAPGFVIRTLDNAFRNYYFLAISLSGWCTLAMMVLIDPAVSQALGFLSILLLFAASCMFAARGTDRPAPVFALG